MPSETGTAKRPGTLDDKRKAYEELAAKNAHFREPGEPGVPFEQWIVAQGKEGGYSKDEITWAKTQMVEKFHKFAEEAWTKEGGDTWGKGLKTRFFVYDSETGTVWANRQDWRGSLKYDPETKLYKGEDKGLIKLFYKMNESENRGALATSWHGEMWATISLKTMAGRTEGAVKDTILHESAHVHFHDSKKERQRVNDAVLKAAFSGKETREWMTVERKALARALELTDPNEKRAWLANALAAREHRHTTGKTRLTRSAEIAFEQSEGVAMFTGSRLRPEIERADLIRRLEMPPAPALKDWSQNGYDTGHAYARLMEDLGPGWRKSDTTKMDLGDKARMEYGIDRVTGKDVEKAANMARDHTEGYEKFRTKRYADDEKIGEPYSIPGLQAAPGPRAVKETFVIDKGWLDNRKGIEDVLKNPDVQRLLATNPDARILVKGNVLENSYFIDRTGARLPSDGSSDFSHVRGTHVTSLDCFARLKADQREDVLGARQCYAGGYISERTSRHQYNTYGSDLDGVRGHNFGRVEYGGYGTLDNPATVHCGKNVAPQTAQGQARQTTSPGGTDPEPTRAAYDKMFEKYNVERTAPQKTQEQYLAMSPGDREKWRTAAAADRANLGKALGKELAAEKARLIEKSKQMAADRARTEAKTTALKAEIGRLERQTEVSRQQTAEYRGNARGGEDIGGQGATGAAGVGANRIEAAQAPNISSAAPTSGQNAATPAAANAAQAANPTLSQETQRELAEFAKQLLKDALAKGLLGKGLGEACCGHSRKSTTHLVVDTRGYMYNR